MRYLVTFLFIAVTFVLRAQNKGVLIKTDKGDVYVQTSGGENDTLLHGVRKIDAIQLSLLKNRADGKLIAGGCLLTIGIGCAATLLIKGFTGVNGNLSLNTLAVLTLGSIAAGTPGIVLSAVGAYQEAKYWNRRKTEVAVIISPAGLGLALNF